MPSNLKRYQTEGHYHFLTFNCYRRLPFLCDDQSRTEFLDILEKVRERRLFFVFGYALMPEQVHLLISEPKRQRLDNTLRVLKGQSSKFRKGSRAQFWQTRYYDFNVFTQAKFVEKLRYIHRNSVGRSLVDKPANYPWSSFRHWAFGERGLVEIELHWTWNMREGSNNSLAVPQSSESNPSHSLG